MPEENINPGPQQQVQPPISSTPLPTKKNNLFWILIAGVLLIILGFGGWYFLYQQGNKSQNSTKSSTNSQPSTPVKISMLNTSLNKEISKPQTYDGGCSLPGGDIIYRTKVGPVNDMSAKVSSRQIKDISSKVFDAFDAFLDKNVFPEPNNLSFLDTISPSCVGPAVTTYQGDVQGVTFENVDKYRIIIGIYSMDYPGPGTVRIYARKGNDYLIATDMETDLEGDILSACGYTGDPSVADEKKIDTCRLQKVNNDPTLKAKIKAEAEKLATTFKVAP